MQVERTHDARRIDRTYQPRLGVLPDVSWAEALTLWQDAQLDDGPKDETDNWLDEDEPDFGSSLRFYWQGLVYKQSFRYANPMYTVCSEPLRYMDENRIHFRQGFGAARTKSERLMDRRPWEDYSWIANEADWRTVGARKGMIFPPSLFKGRPPREKERRVCPQCGEHFSGRKNLRFCRDACKQKAYRERKRYG
jgi:hypothetical protein